MITHELMGGKLHVYKRENSSFWQCSTYLKGRNHRTTTKEESLVHAKQIAEDWYLELGGKARAGLLKTEKTFELAADQFLKEYGIITEYQRSPRWHTSAAAPCAVLRRPGRVRGDPGQSARIPDASNCHVEHRQGVFRRATLTP